MSADDFFQALRETHAFAGRNFESAIQSYHQVAAKNDFVFSILHNADTIQECIGDALNTENDWDPILTQVKTAASAEGTNMVK